MLFQGKARSIWTHSHEGKWEKEESGKNPLCKPNAMYKSWSCPCQWDHGELLKYFKQGTVKWWSGLDFKDTSLAAVWRLMWVRGELEARRWVKVSVVLDGTGYIFGGIWCKIQGPLFKKQKSNSVKGTKIEDYFLSSAVSHSTCHGVFNLLFNVMLPWAGTGQVQTFPLRSHSPWLSMWVAHWLPGCLSPSTKSSCHALARGMEIEPGLCPFQGCYCKSLGTWIGEGQEPCHNWVVAFGHLPGISEGDLQGQGGLTKAFSWDKTPQSVQFNPYFSYVCAQAPARIRKWQLWLGEAERGIISLLYNNKKILLIWKSQHYPIKPNSIQECRGRGGLYTKWKRPSSLFNGHELMKEIIKYSI